MNINRRNLYYVLWLIGVFFLIYFSSLVLEFANEWKMKTYNIHGYNLWLPILISFISGIYLAFINGVPKQIRIDRSRLIVFFISGIALSYFILWFYFNLPVFNPKVYLKMINYNGPFFLGLICGYSAITGLFKFMNQE